MGQVIQVNGDYNIKASVGATITLDTGPAAAGGYTRVTGNLIVEGDTLTVSAQNLNVEDNIITLNFGESPTHAGVTLIYSGIEIERGSSDNSYFLYNEDDDHWSIVNKTDGLYNFDTSYLRLQKISTDADTLNPVTGRLGDLTLIGTGTGIISVKGTLTYESRVTDPDDIPNKAYVDNAIQNSPSRQIKEDNTRVIISDVEALGIGTGGLDYQDNPVVETQIAVIVDDEPNSAFFKYSAQIQDLLIAGSTISNLITSANIYLETTQTGKVQTNYAIQLQQLGTGPASTAGFTHLYAAAPGTGDTGLYSSAGSRKNELISKNRALLYSMLF
jgi:hypothetical protein